MTTKTFRGPSLDEIREQVAAELGEDAVITKQREGVVGGIGGFFGRRCVEVEAQPAATMFLDVLEDVDQRPVHGRWGRPSRPGCCGVAGDPVVLRWRNCWSRGGRERRPAAAAGGHGQEGGADSRG